MPEAKIVWKGNMKFEALTGSGYSILMDARKEVGGDGSAPTPFELIPASFGGCTGMDVVSILKKSRQEVTRFEMQVTVHQAPEHPKRATAIEIEYYLYGKNLDENKVKHAIELSHEKYCPVGATLKFAAPITYKYQIINE
ncbi:MAG: OsmC family protein [bacterium]|nr:OsmC family protein [bacterium]